MSINSTIDALDQTIPKLEHSLPENSNTTH